MIAKRRNKTLSEEHRRVMGIYLQDKNIETMGQKLIEMVKTHTILNDLQQTVFRSTEMEAEYRDAINQLLKYKKSRYPELFK